MTRKQLVSDVEPVGARTIRFCLSTAGVDRDNDTIDPRGWQLDNYRRNPVVLWAHDYRALPVARAVRIGVEGDRLVAAAEFAEHPFADSVFKLYQGGFLRATSVGFRPIEATPNPARGGIDFTKQELLEFSCVPIPANPDALAVAAAKGVDVSLVRGWLARADEVVLDLDDEAVLDVDFDPAADPARRGHRYFDVSRAQVVAAVRRELPGLVRDALGPAVRAGLRAARGRVD
jgi:HK97 family phage prohead protease